MKIEQWNNLKEGDRIKSSKRGLRYHSEMLRGKLVKVTPSYRQFIYTSKFRRGIEFYPHEAANWSKA